MYNLLTIQNSKTFYLSNFLIQKNKVISFCFMAFICLQQQVWGTDQKQKEKIDSLKSVIASRVQDTTIANSLSALSDCYRSLNTDSALFWAQKLISFSQEKKLGKNVGIGFMAKGNIYRSDLKLDSAKKGYLQALNAYQKIGDYDGIAGAYGALMAYHKLANSITDSLQWCFDRIMILKDSIHDKKIICKAYYNFAVRLLETEEYHLATENLMKSIALSEKIQFDECILYAKTSLAVVKYRLKNNNEAIKLYTEIAPKALAFKSYYLYSVIMKNLGVCYETRGDYHKAEEYCRQGLSITRKHNIREGTDLLCRNMGIVKMNLNQMDSAIYYANRALDLVGRDSNYSHIANLLLAEVYIKKREFEKAEKYAMGFMQYQLKQKTLNFVSDSYEVLCTLYEKWGKYNKACDYYKLNADLKDTIFSEENSRRIADMEAWYWSAQKRNELALAKKNEELRLKEVKEARIENELFASQRNGLIVAIILVILFSVLLYRINLQRRKNKLMQQVTELELKAIRAQMNPHFLFNALSAIQMLINKNDIKQSNIALAKFGKLMRLILENSEKQTISIEDEIKTLELYIELEALRFPFNYNLKVDPSLDKENMEIPSMIIQPYVENAIKHGISNKPADRNINVSFNRQDNHLFCTVEDDGVGREMAEATKSKYAQHKSMGTRLSHERLELISKQIAGKAEVVIKDMHTEQGAPSGTRVELSIPITYNAN